MPKGAKDKIDGYILYRKYTCPGQDRPATAPELVVASADGFVIAPISEPVGCDAEYRVSAYGRAGESAPSNIVSAKTASSVAIVSVSFSELRTPKPQSRSVRLSANEYSRVSGQMYMPGILQLNELPFADMTGNNVIAVHLNEDDSIQLGVTLTKWDRSVPKKPVEETTCDIGKTIMPPNDGWEGVKNMPVTLDSGAKPTCSVEIELNGRGAVKAGNEIRPEADVRIVALASVGRDIYVVLLNKGPDLLPSNQIKLRAEWAKKGEPDILLPDFTRWWPPDMLVAKVKLLSIPASEDLATALKDSRLTVKVTPVDFTGPDHSNN